MKAYADCVPCVFAQVLRAARRITNDETELLAVLARAMGLMRDRLNADTPADLASLGLDAIHEYFGVNDLYAAERHRTNAAMLEIENELRVMIRNAADPVRTALRIAAAANRIDVGTATEQIDVPAALANAAQAPFAVDHTDELLRDLAQSRTLLYLADNSGEIVADKLVLETIAHPDVCIAVRGAPVLNDAILEDAEAVGLPNVARVISNGSDRIGTVLRDCSPEFRHVFDSADLIISKGQANYESLAHVEANIYFILTAKCHLVARQFGVQCGETIVARSNHAGEEDPA